MTLHIIYYNYKINSKHRLIWQSRLSKNKPENLFQTMTSQICIFKPTYHDSSLSESIELILVSSNRFKPNQADSSLFKTIHRYLTSLFRKCPVSTTIPSTITKYLAVKSSQNFCEVKNAGFLLIFCYSSISNRNMDKK